MDSSELLDVGMHDIIPGIELAADVYVQLGSGNYIQVAKKGSKTGLQDLHVAEKKANLKFYVKKSEYAQIVELNAKVASILLKRTDIGLASKLPFLKAAAASAFRQMNEFGLDEKLFNQSKSTVAALANMIQTRHDYLAVTTAIAELPGHLVKNSMAVASLSVLIGKVLGWQASSLEKVAMGAMFRDVGLTMIAPGILEKARAEMSALERMTYETHPKKGAEILRRIPGVPHEAVLIAMEHHENAIGQGFPSRSHDFAQHPLSKVVALADAFIDLTMPSRLGSSNSDSLVGNTSREEIEARSSEMAHPVANRTPEEAVHFIESTMGEPFNRSAFLALKKAFEIKH